MTVPHKPNPRQPNRHQTFQSSLNRTAPCVFPCFVLQADDVDAGFTDCNGFFILVEVLVQCGGLKKKRNKKKTSGLFPMQQEVVLLQVRWGISSVCYHLLQQLMFLLVCTYRYQKGHKEQKAPRMDYHTNLILLGVWKDTKLHTLR